MDNRSNNPTPNLSQYFANDPPSFFDDVAASLDKQGK